MYLDFSDAVSRLCLPHQLTDQSGWWEGVRLNIMSKFEVLHKVVQLPLSHGSIWFKFCRFEICKYSLLSSQQCHIFTEQQHRILLSALQEDKHDVL